jgi:predicted  nucleic acid-binding Zn-ribbon protein
MPLKSMKELSQPLTLTIPEDSPIYKALMESTKQKKDEEHKVACLEADLEETTNILTEEIEKLKAENTKLMKEQIKLLDEKESLSKTFWIKNEELKEENEKLKEERKELKKSIEKKDKQIERLVIYKKNRERQVTHIRTICEEKVEDVGEEWEY